jgi:hypothetical protein
MNDQVFNGIKAELISAVLTYPLNTLKTNYQVGKIVRPGFKNLTKGLHWCLLTELANALVFYSVFENIKESKGPLIASVIGSGAAICTSYPLNVRRKLAQVGKSMVIKNNYFGLHIALFNGVPGVTINYTLREKFMNKCENIDITNNWSLIFNFSRNQDRSRISHFHHSILRFSQFI